MRILPAFVILLSVFCAGSAAAQFVGNTPAMSPPPPPPSIDEYNNIPPGMLMTTDDVDTQPTDNVEAAASEDDVMTMDDMVSAYNKGQYDLVAKHIIPVANGNYPQAEELLGIMYLKGQGVEEDPESAFAWLNKAAEAERPLAQHYLGTMTFKGIGTQADPVRALMWMHVAIVHYPEGAEKDRATQDRNNISAQLSRRDRERAFELAHDWLKKRDEAALLDPTPP